MPLLGSTGQVARARVKTKSYEWENFIQARGIQTYVPTGRDIMADSPGETSIVGFGTQLAREILSPGILKRERQVCFKNHVSVMTMTFSKEKGQWPPRLKKRED